MRVGTLRRDSARRSRAGSGLVGAGGVSCFILVVGTAFVRIIALALAI